MAEKLASVLAKSRPHRASTKASGLLWATHPDMKLMKNKPRTWPKVDQAAREAFAAVVKGKKNWPLFLNGRAGTGKTFAALAFLDLVWSPYLYEPLDKLLAGLVAIVKQDEYRGFRTAQGVWNTWARQSVVVLDEIGARDRVSDFHYETVKRAIDEREGKPAVFISNKPLDDLAKIYDDRIASRLAGGTVMTIICDDRRLGE